MWNSKRTNTRSLQAGGRRGPLVTFIGTPLGPNWLWERFIREERDVEGQGCCESDRIEGGSDARYAEQAEELRESKRAGSYAGPHVSAALPLPNVNKGLGFQPVRHFSIGAVRRDFEQARDRFHQLQNVLRELELETLRPDEQIKLTKRLRDLGYDV